MSRNSLKFEEKGPICTADECVEEPDHPTSRMIMCNDVVATEVTRSHADVEEDTMARATMHVSRW
jgi:hypothetical protein